MDAGAQDASGCLAATARCVGEAIEECRGGAWVPSGVVCDPAMGEACGGGVCLDACDAAAAAHSYVGCEYWPTVTTNIVTDTAHYRFAVVVANPNLVVAHVSVDRGGSVVGTADVDPGGVGEIVLPWVMELLDPAPLRLGSENALVRQGAYHLVSSVPITVHQFSPFENRFGDRPSFSNDASLLLPTAALGTDYRVVSQSSHILGSGDREHLNPASPSFGPGTPGFFSVVGTVDDTTVTVRAAARTQPGPSRVEPLLEGMERTYRLNRGDVLQILSKQAFYEEAECTQPAIGGGGCTGGRLTDLTGTRVTATSPVAVFGGHRCVDLPREWLFCDHLEEQMTPVPTWGTRAIGVSSHPIVPEETNIFRIVSAADANHVEVVGTTFGPFDLNDGDFVDFEAQGGVEVRGTGRLQLVQYETSGMRTSSVMGDVPIATGDPAMALVPPTDQYRSDYIFLTPASFPESYVLVVARIDAAPPMLDGTMLDAPSPIAGSEYGWIRAALVPGAHRMSARAAFGITVQGVSPACSYMVPGGLDLRSLVF